MLPATRAAKSKDKPFFNLTVLELVKLIQAALSVFGHFSASGCDEEGEWLETEQERGAGEEEIFDGLLCDVTVEGIQKWVIDIGEPCLGVEPMERVADPMVVAALLSLVLGVRNKLAGMGWGNVRYFPLLLFVSQNKNNFALKW